MKAVLLLCCAAFALAADYPGDWVFEVWTSGRRSERVDDGLAQSKCPPGYALKSCHWEVYKSDYRKNILPDGTMFVDQSDGFYCNAYNQAFGKGVVSSSHCLKVVLTVKSDDRPGLNEERQPIATCPPGYKLAPAGCNLKANRHHQFPLAAALSDKNSCFTSEDCYECKVSARCILEADSFSREVAFPPPVEGDLELLGVSVQPGTGTK